MSDDVSKPPEIQRLFYFLPASLRNPRVILDVGACDGSQSLEFAAMWPNANVYAFEPNPVSYSTMMERFGGIPGLFGENQAVCDRDGTAAFYLADSTNPGASSLFVASGHQEVAPFRQRGCQSPCMRLDRWAAENFLGEFDLVWMDVQGAELLVMQGMGEMLKTVKALHLEVTYRELYAGQAMYPEVAEFLTANGFTIVDEVQDICGWFGNVIAIRTDLIPDPYYSKGVNIGKRSLRT